MNNTDLADCAKHPILLDASHHITKLIVCSCHKKVQHGGERNLIISEVTLQDSKWKELLDAKAYSVPQTPSLPAFRVTESPPFAYVGVDYAGLSRENWSGQKLVQADHFSLPKSVRPRTTFGYQKWSGLPKVVRVY